jgi:hypothetical protein
MKNKIKSFLYKSTIIISLFIGLIGWMQNNAFADVAPFVTSAAMEFDASNVSIEPFINSALSPPPESQYNGNLFQLRHDYPSKLLSQKEYPWKKVTNNGPITQSNSLAYVEALKQYVSDDMRKLLFNYSKWDWQNEPWWQSVWLGTERDPIHGVYVGSGFPAGTLAGQKLDLTTYVFTLYDQRAAVTLNNIWGTTRQQAYNPNLTNPGAQFAEGSVIIKFAFVTPCGRDWKPMKKAAKWQIYFPLNESNGSGNDPKSRCPNNGSNGTNTSPTMTNVYLMQFDIIVKDSQAAPETGWVFSTLIYDKDAPGKDAWNKMIPLGATWGNNPDVINVSDSALTAPVTINDNLTENWINKKVPEYALSTLGWDGRLSGPNDGAVVNPAWAGSHYYPEGLASVGCLGCHSSAQYQFESFLLPTTTNPGNPIAAPGASSQEALVTYVPGSAGWMKWFQNRSGEKAMDPGRGQIGLDYDMVTAFKAIPLWQAAVKAQKQKK